MKSTTKIGVALVALAGVAGAGLAAQAESDRVAGPGEAQQAYGMHHGHHGMRHGKGGHGGSHGHGGGHMVRMLESFDANDDGKLSQEEIDQARGERFGRFDADSDQALTLEEYEQLWLDAMRERMVRAFQRLDTDGDAKVTAEEFQAPYGKMVRRMDRNEDGVLDRGDFQRRHHGDRDRNDDDNG